MAFDFTTTGLLASIRRRAASETATATGTADADLLTLADEELQDYILPILLSTSEEYGLFDADTTMTVGTASYRLPYRAVGAKLREVAIVQTDGQTRNLTRISLDELEQWNTVDTGTAEAFYLKGSNLVVVPTPNAAETLRMTYFIRPGSLTNTASDFKTLSVVSGTALTTGSAHGWTTSNTLDFIKANSPFETLSIDVTPGAASGSSITLSTAITGLAVGDYVCLAQKSPLPQAPAELHPLLAQRVAWRTNKNRGYLQEAGAAMEDLQEMERRLLGVLEPRVDGEGKIAAPSAFGLIPRPTLPWRRW